jgi:hypothetical protein
MTLTPEQKRIRKNKRAKEYAQSHREQIQAYKKEYRIRNKRRLKAKQKKYYQMNRDYILGRVKQYTQDHKDQIKTYKQEYVAKNKRHIKRQQKKYYRKNRDTLLAKAAAYKRKRQEKRLLQENMILKRKLQRINNKITKINESNSVKDQHVNSLLNTVAIANVTSNKIWLYSGIG